MAASVNTARANAQRFANPAGGLADRGRVANRGRISAQEAPPDMPELVVNGTFDADVSGWTAANLASLAQAGGRCRVAHTSSSNPYARQAVTLEVGKTYRFKAQTFANGLNNVIRVGTSPGSGNVINSQTTDDQDFDSTFTATVALHYISLLNFTAVGAGFIEIDNVSLKEVVA